MVALDPSYQRRAHVNRLGLALAANRGIVESTPPLHCSRGRAYGIKISTILTPNVAMLLARAENRHQVNLAVRAILPRKEQCC